MQNNLEKYVFRRFQTQKDKMMKVLKVPTFKCTFIFIYLFTASFIIGI